MKFTILLASIHCALTSIVTTPSHAAAGLRNVRVNAPVNNIVHAPMAVPVRIQAETIRPSRARGLITQVYNDVHPNVGLSHENAPLSPKSSQVLKSFLAAEESAPKPPPKKDLLDKLKDFIADGKRRDRRAKQNARNKLEEILDDIDDRIREPELARVPIPVDDRLPRIRN